MKPKLYIVPGWGEKITGQNYQKLITSVEDRYSIVPIELNLMNRRYVFGKTRLFSEVVEEAKNQIEDSPAKDIILGFSIGALIAYQLATQIKFYLAIICSISPLLGKDLSQSSPKETSDLTSTQLTELTTINYQVPLSSFVLFYGLLESDEVISRSKKLHKNFGGTLISVPKGSHELSGDYLEMVLSYLGRYGILRK